MATKAEKAAAAAAKKAAKAAAKAGAATAAPATAEVQDSVHATMTVAAMKKKLGSAYRTSL